MDELTSPKHRVVALTFTNRARDEIQSRLDRLAINQDQFWSGTIHAFALEWILRLYAPYDLRLQRGFSVADEFFSERVLNSLKDEYGQPRHLVVNTARDRNGNVYNANRNASTIFQAYQGKLEEAKLLDYDDVLFHAYKLLIDRRVIAETLASIIRLICVDEIQDTQDLQFGILSAITLASSEPPTLFFVGDPDQCIYESLGAVTKTTDEISQEFGLQSIAPLTLTGNYRSTQRIIDLYQCFRPGTGPIESLTSYAHEPGVVTFRDQTVSRENLPDLIARLVLDSLDSGVHPSDICVLAPHWWHIRSLARSLVQRLPDIDLDAPGLSPVHCQRDNFWFKVSRLFLTTPSPSSYRTRVRWASEVIHDLEKVYGIGIPEILQKPRALLRVVNSITSPADAGLDYLEEVFACMIAILKIDAIACDSLSQSRKLFFDKARSHIKELGDDAIMSVQNFKKLFRHPSGVVISTCHGVKGEEYDTVIAFGLLRGYVPNWQVIIHGTPAAAHEHASKLLYVICSRAKRRLHLIAESGRYTQNRTPYQTTALLNTFMFNYDAATTEGCESGDLP